MSATTQFTSVPPVPGSELAGPALVPLLRDLVDGTLRSGDEIRVHEFASKRGVGLSDVEDAISRLAQLGLIQFPDDDDEPIRIISFTRSQAAREVAAWAALQFTVIASMPPMCRAQLRRMQRERDTFAACGASRRAIGAAAHLAFFGVLGETAQGFGLRLANASAAYRLRLSDDVLPHDAHTTSALHDAILTALRSDAGHQLFDAEYALREWSGALTGAPLGW